MNVKSFLATAAVILSVSSAVMAEGNTQAATDVPGTATGSTATAPGAAQVPVPFETMKASLLKMIGERIADMQKRQSCIQAAADQKAFTACFPTPLGGRPGAMPMPGMPPSMPGNKPAP